MGTEIFVGWNFGTLILLGILYVVFIRIIQKIEKRFLNSNKRPQSDWDLLTALARRRSCSEYDIFNQATEDWNIARRAVDTDFKRYLREGILPYYVRDYVRKNKVKHSERGKSTKKIPFHI